MEIEIEMGGGGGWPQFLQSVFVGLIFSYLLAKLISLVISFKEDIPSPPTRIVPQTQPDPDPTSYDDAISRVSEHDSLMAEIGSSINSLRGDTDDDEDDDWEGVETTELDENFSAATALVAASAAGQKKVSNDVQLQLYGLYKIATEGPCTTPQPSPLKMTARAKWQAWQKLGAMPPEDAMQKYIDLVTDVFPDWTAGSTNKSKGESSDAQKADARGPMGPVLSTFVYEEEPGKELKLDAIHTFAREGEVEKLLKCVESGIPVNVKDSEGRTPLHWAVDRGHSDVMELLISQNADVNSMDNEGQTPLHYATMCEREAIAKFLVKHSADINVKDEDGNAPCDLCNSGWSWMLDASNQQVG